MPLPGKPARRIADRIKKKAPKPIKSTTIEPARQTTPPVPVVTECEGAQESLPTPKPNYSSGVDGWLFRCVGYRKIQTGIIKRPGLLFSAT